MTISVLRTVDAWWVITPTGAARVDTEATTTAQLLADRPAVEAAASSEGTVAVETLSLLSPVTAPCRVVAQMTNFASHVEDAGMNPDTIPLTFFRKSSGSISGPNDDVIRPAHVRLLDYEVEIGSSSPATSRSGRRSRQTLSPITLPGWSSPTTSPRATFSFRKRSSTKASHTRRSPRSAPPSSCWTATS